MEKTPFSENAKGFFSDWKKEYETDNKQILERKKKRDEEAAKMDEEFKKLWDEFKIELSGKSKVLLDNVIVYYNNFSEAFMKGTATLNEKIQLEKRLEELNLFLKTAGEKGSEKVDRFVKSMKNKLDSFDQELISEKVDNKNIDFEDIKNQAEEEIVKQNSKKLTDFNDIFK